MLRQDGVRRETPDRAQGGAVRILRQARRQSKLGQLFARQGDDGGDEAPRWSARRLALGVQMARPGGRSGVVGFPMSRTAIPRIDLPSRSRADPAAGRCGEKGAAAPGGCSAPRPRRSATHGPRCETRGLLVVHGREGAPRILHARRRNGEAAAVEGISFTPEMRHSRNRCKGLRRRAPPRRARSSGRLSRTRLIRGRPPDPYCDAGRVAEDSLALRAQPRLMFEALSFPLRSEEPLPDGRSGDALCGVPGISSRRLFRGWTDRR